MKSERNPFTSEGDVIVSMVLELNFFSHCTSKIKKDTGPLLMEAFTAINYVFMAMIAFVVLREEAPFDIVLFAKLVVIS